MDSERYCRQEPLIDAGEQKKLKDATVVIVGCGGLGSQLIANLVSVGIGHYVLVDPDIVVESNLNRQFLHFGHLGHHKVDSAEEWIMTALPDATVVKHRRALSDENAESIVAEGDIVADCLDNVQSRHILARACRAVRKPLVHAGVEALFGQVMTFLPDSPVTLEDIMKEDPPFHVAYAPAVSMIGSIQADEVVSFVLGRSEPCTLITLDLDSHVVDRRRLGL